MPKGNPQLEDGYTKIANEVLESLIKFHLSSYEWRIVLVILRKTYGFNKKEDWISLSQFVLATNIQRSHVCRSVNMLIQQNIITKGGTKNRPLYRFQKHFITWQPLPKGARSHHITKGGNASSAKGGNLPVPKGAHTKETITKENNKRKETLNKLRQTLIEKKII
jgi:phage replication O-like protein O